MNNHKTIDQMFTKIVTVEHREFDYESLAKLLYDISYLVACKSGLYDRWDEIPSEMRDISITNVNYLASLVSRRNKGDPVIYHCYIDSLNKLLQNNGWKYGEAMDYENKTNPDMVKYSELNEAVRLNVQIICDTAWNIVHSMPKKIIAELQGLHP